jgi:hypothetical protein
MKDSFDECDLLFEPLPDAISDRPHLIAARLRERIAVPYATICVHGAGRLPSELKYIKEYVRLAGFCCSACGSKVLWYPALIMEARVYLCRCTLVSNDDELPSLRSSYQWTRLQRLYQRALLHQEELPSLSLFFNRN